MSASLMISRVEILYNDSRQVVIFKPISTAIQGKPYDPASRAWHQLVADVEQRINAKEPLKIVHRLDATTSGALILAKTTSAARALIQQFRDRQVEKSYLAIVSHAGHDWMHGEQGALECFLRNDGSSISIVTSPPSEHNKDVKHATSTWKRLSYTTNYSVLQLRPTTGRKHQLRVQCAQMLRSPIVGDFKYGYEGRYTDGHLLHSHELSFQTWGKDGKKSTVTVEAPTSPQMIAFAAANQLQLSLNGS